MSDSRRDELGDWQFQDLIDCVIVLEDRLSRTEEAARDFAAGLDRLADVHHRTLTNSRIHDPERRLDYRECPCKTCRAAADALLARHPGFLLEANPKP